MAVSLSSSTSAKASRSSRWFCSATRTGRQLLDDEVEQHLPRGQGWPGKRQNIMAQPLGERSDVASQPIRPGLGLPRKLQLDDKPVVWTTLAGAVDLGLQLLAS